MSSSGLNRATTPPHIAELLGKQVRVTGPNCSWDGRLIAYAADPSVIIDTSGSRVCLPAAYRIEAAEPYQAEDGGAGAKLAAIEAHCRRHAEMVSLHCPDLGLPAEALVKVSDILAIISDAGPADQTRTGEA